MRARRRVLSALRCMAPNNPSFALCEAATRSIKHTYKGSFSHTLHNCKKSVRIRLCLRPITAPPQFRRLVGYARVSTEDQVNDAQVDELKAAGCHVVHEEHGSGVSRTRPVLAKLLREIAAGDVLVVLRLDRPARSVSHLLEVIEQLEKRGMHFRSLRDPIDTSTPQGMPQDRLMTLVAGTAIADPDLTLLERPTAGAHARATATRWTEVASLFGQGLTGSGPPARSRDSWSSGWLMRRPSTRSRDALLAL
jgi:hypothetical protein